MSTFKRVLAWVVVVLSVLGLLAVLAGIAGSWIVRNKVTDITVNLLTVGERAVAATSSGLNRIDDRLEGSQENISTLESNIQNVAADLQENSLVGTVISNNISEEMATSIKEARATAVSIKDTAVALNEAIETANQIPFVSLDGFVPELIGTVADGLVSLEENVAEFRTAVQERREERLENSADFFTGITGEMSSKIGDIQTALQEVSHDLDETSERLAERKISLPRTYTLITIGVDLVMLLIGLAFFSLLVHAWSFTKNPDQSWHDLVSGTPEAKTEETAVTE